MENGFHDFNFKHFNGGVCKIVERRIKKIGISGVICFDNTNIQFEQYFKPTKPNTFFRVGLFHSYICAN